jgi:hypothetical protein
MRKKKICFTVKKLKEIGDDISASEYSKFFRSLCKKNQKWLRKKYGSP